MTKVQSQSKLHYSTDSSVTDNEGDNGEQLEEHFDELLGEKPRLQPQGVDPKQGWNFRGVHKVSDLWNFMHETRIIFGSYMATLLHDRLIFLSFSVDISFVNDSHLLSKCNDLNVGK